MTDLWSGWNRKRGPKGVQVTLAVIERVRKTTKRGKDQSVRRQRAFRECGDGSLWIDGAGPEHAEALYEELSGAVARFLARLAKAPVSAPEPRRGVSPDEPMSQGTDGHHGHEVGQNARSVPPSAGGEVVGPPLPQPERRPTLEQRQVERAAKAAESADPNAEVAQAMRMAGHKFTLHEGG